MMEEKHMPVARSTNEPSYKNKIVGVATHFHGADISCERVFCSCPTSFAYVHWCTWDQYCYLLRTGSIELPVEHTQHAYIASVH